ncbi:MAG: ATP-binding cassette domain-containing protein [Gammaproteobacteria bacterium]|nr:ATP-binding cassette domain-containing protein [Gammaproteobacteria bacterium]
MSAPLSAINNKPINNQHVQLLFDEPSCCGMTIKNLSIFAKTKTILTVDELRFPKKGVVAIMGPSGSGKSTFLKAMSELMDENLAHKGDIDITCIDTSDECESICSHFAMVWQKPTVFPCSIYDNLKVPLRKRKVARKEWRNLMADSLERVGLIDELDEEWWKQRAQRLSGGQQQRLSIAMGLLKDSNIFLFDEPTSALDPISTEIIERIISDLGKSKLVLLVTHSLGQAKRVSDYSAMFHNHEDKGALCEFSPSEDFFKSPASPQSREFIMMETGI